MKVPSVMEIPTITETQLDLLTGGRWVSRTGVDLPCWSLQDTHDNRERYRSYLQFVLDNNIRLKHWRRDRVDVLKVVIPRVRILITDTGPRCVVLTAFSESLHSDWVFPPERDLFYRSLLNRLEQFMLKKGAGDYKHEPSNQEFSNLTVGDLRSAMFVISQAASSQSPLLQHYALDFLKNALAQSVTLEESFCDDSQKKAI